MGWCCLKLSFAMPFFGKILGAIAVAIRLDEKKAIVAEVKETASDALSLVVADARGVAVSEITDLRKTARENSVQLRVVRNSLARRAFKDTNFDCVSDTLTGPSLFGFSMEDPGAAARIFKDFAKENENFQVKGLSVSGQFLSADQLDVLALLPTREVALSKLVSVVIAPTNKLVSTLNDLPTKLIRVLAAVRDQKQMAA